MHINKLRKNFNQEEVKSNNRDKNSQFSLHCTSSMNHTIRTAQTEYDR